MNDKDTLMAENAALKAQVEQEREYRRVDGVHYFKAAQENHATITDLRAQLEQAKKENDEAIMWWTSLANSELRVTLAETKHQLATATAELSEERARLDWQTGIPDVPVGKERSFWVAFKNSEGDIHSRFLVYQNKRVLPLSDSCYDDPPANAVPVGDEGDYEWTGWVEPSCDQCDTQWTFDNEVIAWMKLPKYAARAQEEKL